MTAPNKFYVYGHYVPGSDTPFYIGKGSNNRAWNKTQRTSKWKEISSTGYEVKILQDGLNEMDAWILEASLITEYGKICDNTGILINTRSGGIQANPKEKPTKFTTIQITAAMAPHIRKWCLDNKRSITSVTEELWVKIMGLNV